MASLRQHQNEFLKDVDRLLKFIWLKGFELSGGELYRTKEQQEIYYKQGLSKTMNSNHLRKLAIDLFIFTNEGIWIKTKSALQEIGDYWESLSPYNRWGGNFKSFTDAFHFEREVEKVSNVRATNLKTITSVTPQKEDVVERPKFGLIKIIKSLFKFKKVKEGMTMKEGVKTSELWVAIGAALVVFCNSYFGWSLDSEQVMQFLAPIMAYLLGRTAVKLKK